jgi:DMSO/TMAO reductase YedYZ molybdopterin-dependent catalytic subunit
MTMDRRTFIRTSALGVAAAAWWLEAPTLARAEATGHLLPRSVRPPNYESVRATFTTRITPLERFYLRNHFDVPEVDLAAWRLRVAGAVETPLALSLADLERLPQVSVEAVLQCAGNGRALFTPRVPGVQWRYGAMGNATWTGPRLRDVLALARPRTEAAHLQLTGADRPTLSTTPLFVRGLPLAKALHEDTLLALRMNGAALSRNHGRPARLIVPGWVADDWMRWLTDIEVRPDEAKGFYYETAYRFPEKPGAPGEAVPADQMRPMTRLNVKSLIGSLEDGQVLRAGTHDVLGVAFSGEAGIERVEVSFDGGATWAAASLEGAATPYGFRLFRHAWKPAPGRYLVAVRATDATGATQPEVPVWNAGGYLYNAWDRVSVEVRS